MAERFHFFRRSFLTFEGSYLTLKIFHNKIIELQKYNAKTTELKELFKTSEAFCAKLRLVTKISILFTKTQLFLLLFFYFSILERRRGEILTLVPL